jgi:hypothetical protein
MAHHPKIGKLACQAQGAGIFALRNSRFKPKPPQKTPQSGSFSFFAVVMRTLSNTLKVQGALFYPSRQANFMAL